MIYDSRSPKLIQNGYSELPHGSVNNNLSLKQPMNSNDFSNKPRNPLAAKVSNNTFSKHPRRGPCFDENAKEKQLPGPLKPSTMKLSHLSNEISTQKSKMVGEDGITNKIPSLPELSKHQSPTIFSQEQNTETPLQYNIQLMPFVYHLKRNGIV